MGRVLRRWHGKVFVGAQNIVQHQRAIRRLPGIDPFIQQLLPIVHSKTAFGFLFVVTSHTVGFENRFDILGKIHFGLRIEGSRQSA